MLPSELSNFDISSQRSTLRMEGNPLDQDLADQLKLGVSHVLDYIRSDIYQALVLFFYMFQLLHQILHQQQCSRCRRHPVSEGLTDTFFLFHSPILSFLSDAIYATCWRRAPSHSHRQRMKIERTESCSDWRANSDQICWADHAAHLPSYL